ncbi:TPA: alcohol dehydrogenase [Candidatus Poribacteria bacterium]|nr:alcohol dehydrogenase [Candidatus Poribacteria bacterium]
MKAIVFHEQGGVEKLRYEDVPNPKINRDEVLVRVRACAVNRLDLRARRDRPEVAPMPHILGSDVAGDVAEVGSEAFTSSTDASPPACWEAEGLGLRAHIKVGERVVIFPCINCGYCVDCINGDESLCDNQKVLGFQTNGGYAEFVKAPERNIIPISDEISYAEAAAVPITFLTAWHMLITRANLNAGEDVLILSAGSGVGSAALQIAKLSGARVFATASTEEKLARAKEFGADFAINYKEVDFSDVVKQLTKGRGVDVVFEHVGADTFEQSINSLAKNGRLVTCGVTSGNMARINIRYIYQKQLSIIGSALGNKRELVKILKLVEQGKLKPIIDQILPLEKAAYAHRLMEDRNHFGKLILAPNPAI